jgi:hypothetical protein
LPLIIPSAFPGLSIRDGGNFTELRPPDTDLRQLCPISYVLIASALASGTLPGARPSALTVRPQNIMAKARSFGIAARNSTLSSAGAIMAIRPAYVRDRYGAVCAPLHPGGWRRAKRTPAGAGEHQPRASVPRVPAQLPLPLSPDRMEGLDLTGVCRRVDRPRVLSSVRSSHVPAAPRSGAMRSGARGARVLSSNTVTGLSAVAILCSTVMPV